MRAGALLVAVPLFLSACGDDDPEDTIGFPGVTETVTETVTEAPAPGLTVFDEAALEGENGVKKILVGDYKMENIESVDCPADQEVKQGHKFTCDVKIGGDEPKDLKVNITVTNEDGEYQVALPEEAK